MKPSAERFEIVYGTLPVLTLDQKLCILFGCRNMQEVAKRVYEGIQKEHSCADRADEVTA